MTRYAFTRTSGVMTSSIALTEVTRRHSAFWVNFFNVFLNIYNVLFFILIKQNVFLEDCLPGYLSCDGVCVNSRRLCDGVIDCPLTYIDELEGCPGILFPRNAARTCA